ncbi:hypothetical protein VIS19158_22723, partial [Vibrio scophthalmi LMG 19158]
PFLAMNINKTEKHEIDLIRKWIVALPPETLANLLTALCQGQTRNRVDSNGQLVTAEWDNNSQAQAIVKIMQWLAEDQTESDETNQRQWKEALIAMADLPKYSKDYSEEWEGYKKQWFKLAEFINETGDMKYIDNFTYLSHILCGNMVLTRRKCHIMTGIIGGVERYNYAAYPMRCVPNASLGKGTLAIVSRKTDLAENHWRLEQTNEIIINWSIDEITL